MAAAFRILGEGQLSLTKFLLVLDRPTDLRKFPSVLEQVLERLRPRAVAINLLFSYLDDRHERAIEALVPASPCNRDKSSSSSWL